MVLGELIGLIELLQERIRSHNAALRENETRTRMAALIDPLLHVLGWDVSDPRVVMPEYKVSGGLADYALLKPNGSPAATVEAKKLGAVLESHRMQMLNYANASGTDSHRMERRRGVQTVVGRSQARDCHDSAQGAWGVTKSTPHGVREGLVALHAVIGRNSRRRNGLGPSRRLSETTGPQSPSAFRIAFWTIKVTERGATCKHVMSVFTHRAPTARCYRRATAAGAHVTAFHREPLHTLPQTRPG